MTQGQILDMMQVAIWTLIKVSAPPLLMGLVVGIIVSIFQTITSIQEATLAFVPKILAVFLGLVIFGSWMLTSLEEYIVQLYTSIPELLTK